MFRCLYIVLRKFPIIYVKVTKLIMWKTFIPVTVAKIKSTKTIENFVRYLIFICPCISNIIPNYYQQDATYLNLFISTDAVHVSGGG